MCGGCGGALVGGRATLVAGHSAYVPHGIHGRVLLDLGDFLDNSPVDPLVRNDLSRLVTLEAAGPRRIEGVPVKLEYAHRRVADDDEAHELLRLMARRCARVGSQVENGSADGSCSSSDRRCARSELEPAALEDVPQEVQLVAHDAVDAQVQELVHRRLVVDRPDVQREPRTMSRLEEAVRDDPRPLVTGWDLDAVRTLPRHPTGGGHDAGAANGARAHRGAGPASAQ